MNIVAAIENMDDSQQILPSNKRGDISNQDVAKKGKVTQRNYVMNDLGALRKKLKHEGRKHDFILSKEAKDGSNAVVQMKTSFFEYTKAKLVEEIQDSEDIINIENAEAAKAATESSGDAYVEYSLDITFRANNTEHTIKIIAYTTTCQLMIQPKGEQNGPKAHLGSRGTPRYFVEAILIPWCEKAVESKAFNEKISAAYSAAIKDEIRRMEGKKGVKHGNTAGEITDAKCVSKGCSFKGLDPNNKSAVGVCAKCGNFEHFACVKIRAEHKEDILRGTMKYYCSLCFAKNPSIGTPEVQKPRPRINSIPVMGQGYNFKVTQSTTATSVPTSKNKALTIILNCETCPFETENQESLDDHIKSEHSYPCDNCEVKSKTKSQLEEHIKAHHVLPCTKCDTMTLTSQSDLDIHMKACHELPCDMCTTIFGTVVELDDHKKISHTNSCKHCNNTYTNQSDLDDHMEKCHKLPCRMCSETFIDVGQLLEHHKGKHVIQCNHCEATFTSEDGLENHIQETHSIICTKCNKNFPVNTNMEEHMLTHHVPPTTSDDLKCRICDKDHNTIDDLKKHMELEHTFHCERCPKQFKTNSQMKVHMLEHSDHNVIKCKSCEKTTINQKDMDDHVKSTHSFLCPKCKTTFSSSILIEEHMRKTHPLSCMTCHHEFSSQGELEKHIGDTHTFVCDVCSYKAVGEDSMENHILENHARPDSDGEYKCDECNFKTKDKYNFGRHYKEVHGSQARMNGVQQPALEARVQEDFDIIKEENRRLKNNFERLEAMYHESLDEINKVKSEYEAKIIIANENNERLQSENEILKEKVDVLFKLGRSYINNSNKNHAQDAPEDKTGSEDPLEIEVIPIDEENENLDDLQAWTVNKMRGFKRNNPSSEASKVSHSKQMHTRVTKTQKLRENEETPNNTASQENSATRSNAHSTGDPPNEVQRRRYCHYFVNQGKCLYEERTGLKCKFEHKVAPLCNFGIRCNRHKCMYSHPKTATTNNFLGKNFPIMNPGPNVWQVMNPWLQNQNQFPPNPWITQRYQRN